MKNAVIEHSGLLKKLVKKWFDIEKQKPEPKAEANARARTNPNVTVIKIEHNAVQKNWVISALKCKVLRRQFWRLQGSYWNMKRVSKSKLAM